MPKSLEPTRPATRPSPDARVSLSAIAARGPHAGWLVGAALLAVVGCRDAGIEGPDAGGGDTPDVGLTFPDARVLTPPDARVVDAGVEVAINSLTPARGPEVGGTRVVLRGRGFGEPAQVFVGGAPATSVVALGEGSIGFTTPAGAPGDADVRVVVPAGEAVRLGGFRYTKDLRILAVEPTRIPEEGGVPLAIVGRGFDEDTLILVDRRPLAGQRLVSDTRIEGYAPRGAPGRPEIYATTREAEDRRSDLLVVFATPELSALAPGWDVLRGGRLQAAAGGGLGDVGEVVLGATPARPFSRVSPARLEFSAPAVAREGVYDVAVANADASGRLAGGYVAVDPRDPRPRVVGVVPPSAAAGDTVTVVGVGLSPGAVVRIGGVDARVVGGDPPLSLTAIVPSGLSGFDQAVSVYHASTGTLAAAQPLGVSRPITLTAVEPARGPVGGGNTITIRGAGFAGLTDLALRLGDVPLADVVVVSDAELTARVVAGAHGPAALSLTAREGRARLAGAYFFEEAFDVLRVEPADGSIAGNTYVSVFGRGLLGGAATSSATVIFGGAAGRDTTYENGSIIATRTRAAASGSVDVRVRAAGREVTLDDAYTFFDPRVATGGVWGGPIFGAVNVGVLNPESGMPIEGVVVQLGYDADPTLRAVTDANGLATISTATLRGPQTVTIGQNELEHVTYLEAEARNVTLFASPFPQSAPPDAPLSPCPTPSGSAPIVRGQIFRVKSALDPDTRPGWIPVVRITYSQSTVFGPNPPQPAEQVDFVFADGESYEIVVMRAGTVAVYAVLGDFNQTTQEFVPRRMGIARSVPAAPNQVTEGVNIALDLDLDYAVDLRLDAPPAQVPGPTINAVFPFLNLGSDGVIPFDPTAIAERQTIRVANLPNVPAASFFYMSGSFTLAEGGGLSAPYSLTLGQSDDDPADGVDLGPFLSMPEDVLPKTGTLLEGGRLSWTQRGLRPDVTYVAVTDSRVVGGCCCMDLNQNGQCEAEEPPMCGGLPQSFQRWTVFAQGGLQSYPLPRMPSGVNAFETPRIYQWLVQQAVVPRFDGREWIVNQYSPFFWKSWTLSFDAFLAKEETE